MELDVKNLSVKRGFEEEEVSKIIGKVKFESVDSNLENGNDNAEFVKRNLQHPRKQQLEIQYTMA